MKWNEYVEKASRTDAPLATKRDHDEHMVMGMVTEAAELLDVFKKNLAYKKSIDLVNVKEEIGDYLWYLANFCRTNNLDIEEIMEMCINKLITRYPEKFTEHNAINRDLEKERQTLEKQ